jgi:hypothetical protein
MTNEIKLDIYKAQVKNVIAIRRSFDFTNRNLNNAMRRNKQQDIEMLWKELYLKYVIYSESLFWKTVYTPYGFSISEIDQIIKNSRKNGISEAWKKCLELGLKRIRKINKNDYNRFKNEIGIMVNKYILQPSQIRNKIAHGQWEIALNNDLSNINQDLTIELKALNGIDAIKLKKCFEYFCDMIEILIESPEKTFRNNYWVKLNEMKEYIKQTATWSFSIKQAKLTQKPIK